MPQKILSLYVNLGDEELHLPDHVYGLKGIIHVCPGSLEGKMIDEGIAKPLSQKGKDQIVELLERGWLLGQRGLVEKCRYSHRDGTDPWHENMCLYNPTIPLNEQIEFMEKGKLILEKRLGVTPQVYSPINHLWDNNTAHAAEKLNYGCMMDKNCTGVRPYYHDNRGIEVIPEVHFPRYAGFLIPRKNAAVYAAVSDFRSKSFSNLFWIYSQFHRFVLPDDILKVVRSLDMDVTSSVP